MTVAKVMLICSQCSMRIRELDPADVPERGIVCRCGHRLLPATLRPDPGRRRTNPLPECQYRGQQLSTVDCQCAGQVRVFGCSHVENHDGLALSHRTANLKSLPEDSLPSCRQCPFQREESAEANVPAQPTLLQMARSATAAAFSFVTSGGKLLPRETRDARLATCRGCPALAGSQCTDCGCIVAIKAWLPAEKCPRRLWPSD